MGTMGNKEKFNLIDIDEYVDLGHDVSCLDGWFTANELKRIAAAMEKFYEEKQNERRVNKVVDGQ